jgi:hypothetical protein
MGDEDEISRNGENDQCILAVILVVDRARENQFKIGHF